MNLFVRVVLRNEAGLCLVVQSVATGLWNFPGGKVEDGETPLAAAVRETSEETGIRLRHLAFLARRAISVDGTKWIGYFYIATPRNIDGPLLLPEPECLSAIKFASNSELATLDCIPGVLADIASLLPPPRPSPFALIL